MDEMDRDLHAIWRLFHFLQRTGRLSWDPETTAEVVGEYVRDPLVRRDIENWRYPEVDGLGAQEDRASE